VVARSQIATAGVAPTKYKSKGNTNFMEISTCSLSSGSGGNCIFVGCGDTNILIDAGRSAKATVDLLSQIGVAITDINAIFITHEHIDHVSGLKIITGKYKIPVYMVRETFDELPRDYKTALGDVANFITPDKNEYIEIGGLRVKCYPIPHDSAANVGYIISPAIFPDDDKANAVGIATDIGHVSKTLIDAVCGCGIIYIESNHDVDMLRNSSYPQYLKHRIKSKFGHLSNKECAEVLPYLIKNGARNIILYHLSAENNTTELAVSESRRRILEAELNVGTVYLGVAPKSSPSKMVKV